MLMPGSGDREWIMYTNVLYSNARPVCGAQEPAIAVRIAQSWFGFGCLAVLCLPALRGRSEWIGWLPLWLVVVPAAQLAILRWRALIAAADKAMARWRERGIRDEGRGARNVRHSSASWNPVFACNAFRRGEKRSKKLDDARRSRCLPFGPFAARMFAPTSMSSQSRFRGNDELLLTKGRNRSRGLPRYAAAAGNA
jgi:hypothetical protein